MKSEDFPAPKGDGFVITQFLVVSDQDRSRDFYQRVFGAQVVLERDPVIMKLANTWLILNAGGGPTDDKPTVTLSTPSDPNRTSAFMNIRVGVVTLDQPADDVRELLRRILDAVDELHLWKVHLTVG